MTVQRSERRARTLAKLAEALGIEEADRALALGAGPLLRTGEVALLFGVSEDCIRKWSDEGKLPSFRTLGRHRLFRAHDVADALRSIMPAGRPYPEVSDVSDVSDTSDDAPGHPFPATVPPAGKAVAP